MLNHTTTQEDEMSTTTTGTPTTESEKARQAHVIRTTGTKVDGTAKVIRFDRYTANVAGTDCRNIHPNGHITPDNAELCGIDRAVMILAELDGLDISPEAVETASTVTIETFDRFWCGRDDHPFGHGTVQTAKHGTNRASGTKAARQSIKVVAARPAQTTQPTTSNADKPKERKLRSGSEGNTQAA